MRSTFKQFMKVSLDHKQISGFSLDVFEAAVKLLNYKLSYETVHFYGSDDDLLKEQGDYSQPYVDPGLVMVVTTEANKSQPWLYISIFTPGMWFLFAATSFFNGFVIWVVEHQNHNESGGSPASDAATVSPARHLTIGTIFAFANVYGANNVIEIITKLHISSSEEC
ncbi:glutamate receptor 3 plant, putative [Ricinus communis]|uniref:Glutamate receptor 3 plant, putative n=1 Tax=Ricinus communis TaxID=3988 RepID=B9SC64_RICCO|nr:glutamate receptor 3 plant, putative [Ricinus communis]